MAESKPGETDSGAGDEHTSLIMHRLIQAAPPDYFTLDWFINQLPRRSFGIILLFLALVSLLPIISIASRLLILVLTTQIILGYPAPVLSKRLVNKPLPSRYLKRLERHIIPMLERLEMLVRPRCPLILRGTRRIACLVALLLTVLSLLAPVPLANVPPAIICVLMALAYIEHDGLLLIFSFIASLTLLIGTFAILV